MPNETVRLFDKWKKVKAREMGLKELSDYEAARVLGVSRNAVSQWRNRPRGVVSNRSKPALPRTERSCLTFLAAESRSPQSESE